MSFVFRLLFLCFLVLFVSPFVNRRDPGRGDFVPVCLLSFFFRLFWVLLLPGCSSPFLKLLLRASVVVLRVFLARFASVWVARFVLRVAFCSGCGLLALGRRFARVSGLVCVVLGRPFRFSRRLRFRSSLFGFRLSFFACFYFGRRFSRVSGLVRVWPSSVPFVASLSVSVLVFWLSVVVFRVFLVAGSSVSFFGDFFCVFSAWFECGGLACFVVGSALASAFVFVFDFASVFLLLSLLFYLCFCLSFCFLPLLFLFLFLFSLLVFAFAFAVFFIFVSVFLRF